MSDVLTSQQRTVAEELLGREDARRAHVVVALSGAHAYGFPSPDSNLDLKGVHAAPAETLLGMRPNLAAADFIETVDGVEVDYTSNELGGVVSGILGGNGNFIERILGAHILRTSDAHRELVPLCRRALCRRVHRHYRGFAQQQLKSVERAEQPSAKSVLYVLRTALTGNHLLRSGELVVDVRLLLDDVGLGEAHALIEQKRAGERVVLSAADKARWLRALTKAMDTLDAAHDRSALPIEPTNVAELDAWLIATRKATL